MQNSPAPPGALGGEGGKAVRRRDDLRRMAVGDLVVESTEEPIRSCATSMSTESLPISAIFLNFLCPFERTSMVRLSIEDKSGQIGTSMPAIPQWAGCNKRRSQARLSRGKAAKIISPRGYKKVSGTIAVLHKLPDPPLLSFTALSLVRKRQKRDTVQRIEFRILVNQGEIVDYGCRCDPRIRHRDFIAGFESCRRQNKHVV